MPWGERGPVERPERARARGRGREKVLIAPGFGLFAACEPRAEGDLPNEPRCGSIGFVFANSMLTTVRCARLQQLVAMILDRAPSEWLTIHELSSVSGDCVTADVSRSRIQTAVPRLKRELAWSGSILFHQHGSALADFLELYFKATKLLRA